MPPILPESCHQTLAGVFIYYYYAVTIPRTTKPASAIAAAVKQ